MTTPRIALIHDWLTTRGGAERVLLRLHALWPSAPIYTLAARRDFIERWLPDAFVRVSGLGKLPFASRAVPMLAPLLPSAIESFNLADYDIVISSSVLFSKGVITRARTNHISYCFSPTRMLWDRNAEYERSGMFSRLFRHGLRLWDYQAAQRPESLIAISQAVQQRIAKYYGRDADIIHPPIEIDTELATDDQGYYLVVGRLMPHTRLDMVLAAFAKLKRPLVIAGSGPLLRKLKAVATDNVRFVTDANDRDIAELYASCHAVIVPNEEDFGMTAAEALGYGKPVLALRAGGVLDVLEEGVTGEYFDEPIPEALAEGVLRMDRGVYDPRRMKRKAEPFLAHHFDRKIVDLVTAFT